MKKILVVEDEKKVANFLQQGLAEEHYTVEIASDGEAGSELAMSGRFDLIILDIMEDRPFLERHYRFDWMAKPIAFAPPSTFFPVMRLYQFADRLVYFFRC